MTNQSKFYIAMKVITGAIGALNLGICTSFLLQKSITFFELSVIYSLILGVSMLCEIPSGNLADRYGRKKIYAVGLLVTALQYVLYGATSHIWLLLLAAAFGGVGDALISGSFEAWITREEKKGKQSTLHRTFGMSRSLTSFFSIGVSLVTGLLLTDDLVFFYWIGAGLFVLCGLITLMLFEDNRGSEQRGLEYTSQSFRIFFSNKTYLFLSLLLAAAFSIQSIFVLYWQPRSTGMGLQEHNLPLLNSIYLFGAMVSSYLFSRWGVKKYYWSFLICSFFILGISFVILHISPNMHVYSAGLLVYGIGFGSLVPVFFSWAAEIVPDDQCASVLSLMSLVSSLVAVVTNMGVGALIEQYSLDTGAYIGVGTALLSGLLLITSKRMISAAELEVIHALETDAQQKLG